MVDHQLSRADKIRIRRTREQMIELNRATVKDGGPDLMECGADLANMLRGELPDLGDVEMGRVVLILAHFLEGIFEHTKCGSVLASSIQIKAAGIDLTAPEWEEFGS